MTGPTREELLIDVLDAVTGPVDAILRRRAVAAARTRERRRTRDGLAGRAKAKAKKLLKEFVLGSDHLRQGQTSVGIDQRGARQHARTLLANGPQPGFSDEASLSEVAWKACVELGVPDAAPLTTCWFDGGTLSDGDVKMDTGRLALLVGAAAAAVVIAILWTLRRGRSVRVRARDVALAGSPDFTAVLEVANGGDEAAEVAQRLVDDAREPWRWELFDALPGLDEASVRTLLSRLASLGLCSVSAIDPAAGSRFDRGTMNAPGDPTPDDAWIVAGVESGGHLIGKRVAHKANVEISTIDAWVLLDERCAVGSALRARAEDLLPGGHDGRRKWRATWGVTYPEDLREMFDEASLKTWRTRMIADMNPAYNGVEVRQLALTGQPGAVFETSTMEADGEVPPGDAVVAEVVQRDGVPQHGLACPGGSPLLLAVVRAKPAVGA